VRVVRIQPQPVLECGLRLVCLAEIERCHAAHEMGEREAWAERDCPLGCPLGLLQQVRAAACDREAVVRVGVRLIEVDGGQRGRETLLAATLQARHPLHLVTGHSIARRRGPSAASDAFCKSKMLST
jgi:hypothetical protein